MPDPDERAPIADPGAGPVHPAPRLTKLEAVDVATAETEIARLLRQAEDGYATVITRDGVPIARLAPVRRPQDPPDPPRPRPAKRPVRHAIQEGRGR